MARLTVFLQDREDVLVEGHRRVGRRYARTEGPDADDPDDAGRHDVAHSRLLKVRLPSTTLRPGKPDTTYAVVVSAFRRTRSTQGSKKRADVVGEQLRLFERRKVS